MSDGIISAPENIGQCVDCHADIHPDSGWEFVHEDLGEKVCEVCYTGAIRKVIDGGETHGLTTEPRFGTLTYQVRGRRWSARGGFYQRDGFTPAVIRQHEIDKRISEYCCPLSHVISFVPDEAQS